MDAKGEEISAVIAEIRARVRSRYPDGMVLGDVPLADTTPLLHARDSAEGKVASIGAVNPRPPGLVNSTIQAIKRTVARALDWHVREQVEFNRAVVSCVQATIEAVNDCNRGMVALAGKIEAQTRAMEAFGTIRDDVSGARQELNDVRRHWQEWRQEWERKLSSNEIHFLRSVSDLHSVFQHRVNLLEQSHDEKLKAQHADYQQALERAGNDIQKKLWTDLDRIRVEYETIIHAELRLLRQKSTLAANTPAGAPPPTAGNDFSGIDWLKFAEKFRGAEDYVKERQQMYAERFRGARDVLDIGCGRGEMLEVLRDARIPARGIDLSPECVALSREKGVEAEQADLFEYLGNIPDSSLGGIVCSQVVEHLPPARVPELVRLAHAKLRRGALLAIETPNPECLAIFATHFFIDPTHTRPIPPPLMAFYFEETGFGHIGVSRLYPAVETMPSLAGLPESFRKDFFGSLDYAIFGAKLSA